MEAVSKIDSPNKVIFSDEFIKDLYSLDPKARNSLFVGLFPGLDVINIPDHGVPQIGKSDFQNPKGWVNIDNNPPYVEGWEYKDYMNLIPHFKDPFPNIVKEHDGILVVRDDLLPGNLGSKARYAEALMQEVKEKYLFYAMVKQGQALKVLAATAKKYNKVVVGIAPLRNEPVIAHEEAMAHGAIMMYYQTGGMAGARKRCRAFIHDHLNGNGLYIPAGVKHAIITAGFAKSVRNIVDEYKPDVIFSVASTMVMNHGIQVAAPECEVHAIQVAGNKASIKWPGRAVVHIHEQPFNEPCKSDLLPPFPSIPEYDGKGWQYAVEYKKNNPDKKVMFWNVAGPHNLEDIK